MKQHILLTEGVYNKNQLKPWSPPSKGTGNGSGKGTPTSISDIMDNNSNDSHEEGNERAKDVMKDKGNPKIDPKDLDKHSKEAEKKMSQDGDGTKAPVKVGDPEGKSTANGNPGSGKASTSTQVECVFSAKVNWKTIIRNFVSKSIQTVEDETWRRPSRRSAASADVQIKQVGASAIRPAKEMREFVVMNCAIVIDASGSVASAVPRVFAELRLLMKEPQFANCVMPVLHFNDGPGDKFLVDINKSGLFTTDSSKTIPLGGITALSLLSVINIISLYSFVPRYGGPVIETILLPPILQAKVSEVELPPGNICIHRLGEQALYQNPL